LGDIRIDDIVEVDKKGRKFRADVRGKQRGELQLKPINPNITHFSAKAREVTRHWRLAGRPKNTTGHSA
jgi:hypothetical protein